MKHIYLLFALLFAAPAVAVTPEQAPIVALNSALLAAMQAGSANASFQSRFAALSPTIQSSFNLAVILQNSVGVLWSTVPAAQQQQLGDIFETFTVDSYVHGFSGYGGQQIQLLPAEKSVGAKKIVETQIVPADGSAPVRLDYVMADGPAGWQVTDVLFNGTISRVAVQSSDFSSLVMTGDASQLIAALQAKVAALSAGGADNASAGGAAAPATSP